ncbi:hypothetical protein GCM10017688_15400 [Streptomyces ramulosus]
MSPLVTAEQAVLGAVLLDPGQLSHLKWLAPNHFSRPAHRALFAALRTLRNDGHPALAEQPVPLSWVTDAIAEASLHVRALTSSYAHTLIQSCPRPAHAPVYGRMVLEGAIHRTITEHAVRLHQAARADALRGDVKGAMHHADVLAGVLGDLARRWGTEPRPVAAAAPPSPLPTVPPTASGEQVAEEERFLLAVLAERPKAMVEVSGGCGRATSPTRPTGSSTAASARSTTGANPSTTSHCSGKPSGAACWPAAHSPATSSPPSATARVPKAQSGSGRG